MNADTSDTEALIERELTGAVGAFRPPPDLKRIVRERMEAERRREAQPAKVAFRPWLRRAAVSAAAACLVVALLWLIVGGGSTPSAYAELAQALENSQAAEWVHAIQTQGKYKTELWVTFRPYRVFSRIHQPLVGDLVTLVDHGARRAYEYQPSTRTLTIDPIDGGDPTGGGPGAPGSLFEFVKRGLDQAKKTGAKVTRTTETIDGKTFTVFTMKEKIEAVPPKPGTFQVHKQTWLIDPKTSRIVRAESETPATGKVTATFDYPRTGPADVFALGVPRDAKIVDRTKTAHGRAPNAFEREFAKAIKLVDQRADWPATPEAVCKAYWEARAAKRWDEMAVLWPGSAAWEERLKDEKPGEYVFGKAREVEGLKGVILVPYASAGYFRKHGTYNLNMRLTNNKSTKGRYYIVSGN